MNRIAVTVTRHARYDFTSNPDIAAILQFNPESHKIANLVRIIEGSSLDTQSGRMKSDNLKFQRSSSDIHKSLKIALKIDHLKIFLKQRKERPAFCLQEECPTNTLFRIMTLSYSFERKYMLMKYM